MSARQTQIALIGGGLAAHTAARALYKAGADALMIAPPSPGASALWSGLAQVFGPTSDFPSGAIGLFESRVALPSRIRLRRTERFNALKQRRQFHPYRRLFFELKQVESTLDQALKTLDYPGFQKILPEITIPSPAATPVAADLGTPSTIASAIGAGERVGIVSCPALVDWFPQRLIRALNEANAPSTADKPAPQARLIQLDIFEQPGPARLHSAAVAANLEKTLDKDPEALSQALLDASDSEGFDLIILPPVIGRTWPIHASIMAQLQDALPCRVAEASAARNSIHGWRLDRYLRAKNPLKTLQERALKIEPKNGDKYRIHTASGTVEARAVIVATGRWVGRGLPAGAPFREPLLDADLWVDGAPIPDPDEQWARELIAPQPWQDHPLFRAGLATDSALRPLARDGQPLAANIFAAGRVLAGFNPFWDGTTEGVDLITGYIAAQNALKAAGVDAQNHLAISGGAP